MKIKLVIENLGWYKLSKDKSIQTYTVVDADGNWFWTINPTVVNLCRDVEYEMDSHGNLVEIGLKKEKNNFYRREAESEMVEDQRPKVLLFKADCIYLGWAKKLNHAFFKKGDHDWDYDVIKNLELKTLFDFKKLFAKKDGQSNRALCSRINKSLILFETWSLIGKKCFTCLEDKKFDEVYRSRFVKEKIRFSNLFVPRCKKCTKNAKRFGATREDWRMYFLCMKSKGMRPRLKMP